jgi:hypothetical protein
MTVASASLVVAGMHQKGMGGDGYRKQEHALHSISE